MAINKKRILKHLKAAKGDRGKVTLYISHSLFKTFKKACGDHSASSVIEEMMKEFMATS